MTNEIFREDRLAVELIAAGSTLDNDPGYQGKIYEIRAWTFRMNHVGLNRWIFSDEVFWLEEYFHDEEARAEYEARKADHEQKREELEAEVRALLGIQGGGVTIKQNVSEIFTAVQIVEVEQEQPKKASVAERLQRSASMLNAMLCCMI